MVPDGSILAMKYKAYLENGEVIDNHEELKITFKDGKMVHGLRTLMLKMCMNTKYKTVIPPHYAYGEKGIKGIGFYMIPSYMASLRSCLFNVYTIRIVMNRVLR